jgi:hypothetical protein
MAKKKINIESNFATDIFNLFVFIALGPVDLASRMPVYPISIVLVILITAAWSIPMFFIGSVLSTMISVISMLNKVIKSLIY